MVTNCISPERDSIVVSLDVQFLVSIKPLVSASGKRPVHALYMVYVEVHFFR